MRADLLNQPVRLERTRRRRIYNTNPLVRFPALRGRGPVTKRRRDGREVAPPPIRFHKTNPRPCSVRKAVLQFEPARPVSGGARSQSGYKTKARWAEVAPTPIRFHKTNPRPCGGRKAVLQFGFRRCAVAVPVTKRSRDGPEVAPPPIRFHKTNPRPCGGRKAVLQFEPARPVSGFARSQSSATRSRRFTRQTCGVRHDQANAVLAETHASKIFEKSVFRIRSNNDGTRPGYSRSIVTTRWKLLIPFGEILVIARNTHVPRQVEAWRHAEASAPRVSDGSH
jgi:hypothetical protein